MQFSQSFLLSKRGNAISMEEQLGVRYKEKQGQEESARKSEKNTCVCNLTKVNGDVFRLADEIQQFLILVFLNHVARWILLQQDPFKDAFLVLQVAGVNHRFANAIAEEDDSRKGKDSQIPCHLSVVDHNEIDTCLTGLIVNVFQFGQDSFALFTIVIAV